jgi:hypothetical protein
MKIKLLLVIACIGCFSVVAFSQARFGIRAGLSTSDINPSQLVIKDEATLDEFTLAVKDAKYGIHAGVFAKLPIGKILFLQPEILFNSNRVDFERGDLNEVFKESYQYLDIPVMAGLKLGPIKPQIGLVGHVFLNSTSEFNLESYREDFKDFTLGWQGGLGLEIKKIFIDFKYEGNFSNFGDHIVISGQRYEFDDKPSRLIMTIGLAF